FSQNPTPMGEVTGLGGDGGMGKTQIALQLTARCATESADWLGSELPGGGPAAFFTAEEPAGGMHFRLNQIREPHQLTWSDLANLHLICPDIDPTLAGLVKRTGKVEPPKTFAW